MITFYPIEAPMWEEDFDFHPDITLVSKTKTYYKVFRTRPDLLVFLVQHDIKLNVENGLRFESSDAATPGFDYEGELLAVIVKGEIIGWFRDNYK